MQFSAAAGGCKAISSPWRPPRPARKALPPPESAADDAEPVAGAWPRGTGHFPASARVQGRVAAPYTPTPRRMEDPQRSLGQALRRDFRAGITIVVPIAVTAWALTWLFRFFDGVLGPLAAPFLPIPLPGLGFLLLLVVVIAVGAVSRSRAGVAVILWLDRRLKRIPLASWVYGTATQITHSTMDATAGSFKRCVLVEYPKEGSWALGFLTAEAPRILRRQLGIPDLVAVFVPTTPNPTSGFMLLVPEADTVDAGIPTETGFRLIISAGSIQVDAGEPGDARRTLADFLERI